MRWSRVAVSLMALALVSAVVGCGSNDGTAGSAGDDPSFATGSPVVFEAGRYPLGEYVDWDDTLRIRADVVGVDSDELGPWLTVAVRVENTSSKPRTLPYLELSCDQQEGGSGVLVEGAPPAPTRVPASDAVEYEQRLTLSGDGRTGDSIPACRGEVTIDLTLQEASSASSMPAWTVPDDVVDELNASRPTPPSGGQQEVSPGVLIDVSVDSVGGDGQQAWLNVMVSYDSDATGEQTLDPPTLHCAQSDDAGQPRRDDLTVAGSGGMQVGLLMPRGADGEPLTTCRAPAYVEIGSARWTLAGDELAYLNEELARDPGRPYHWIAANGSFSSGYQVVVVPRASAAEALAALGPRRRKVSQERFWAIRVAEHAQGVVLFTWGLVSDEQVVALSRIGGLAASYGNTVEGDDHILVARNGEVVRSFNPFLDHDYKRTRRLPEEKGLDLENDTGPASWTLLERLTKIHITEDWLLDDAHPAYLLR